MSETPLSISCLNDFVFCPVSIYFHMPDEGDRLLTQDAYQLNGSDAHKKSDLAVYSTKKSMLQGLIIISYDIVNDKKRARFNRYIRKFGHMLRYSVYEIENSERILNNIITDINNRWLKEFDQTDSVYVFKMSSSCQVEKYGYARNEDAELLIVT